ncbi:MAG: methyl-accepting chemotaxis protein [Bacillota bacterium]
MKFLKNIIGKIIQARVALRESLENYPGYAALIKLIGKISIRRRLIIFFLGLSIIPIIFIGYFSYNSAQKAIINKITIYSQESLTQSTVNLQLEFNRYEELSMQLLINSEKNNAVVSFIDNGLEGDKLKELLKATVGFDESIRSIFIGSLKDDTSVGAGLEDPSNGLFAKFKKTAAFKEAFKRRAQGQIYWGNYETDVVMVRIINNFATGEPIGVYGVVFFGYQLTKLMNPSRYDPGITSVKDLPYTMIVMPDRRVLASPNSDDVGLDIAKLLKGPKIKEILAQRKSYKGEFKDQLHNEGILVTYTQMGKKDWYLLGISTNVYLFKEIKAVGYLTFLLVLLLCFISVVVSLLVSLSISTPLVQVKEAMKEAENGNLAIKVVVKTQDELAALGNSFNLMSTKIGELIEDTMGAVTAVSEHSRVLEESSNQSAKASESVAAAAGEITRGTMEQTSEAEKAVAQMEELAGRIELAVSNSHEVQQVIDSIRELSSNSKNIVELLINKANETGRITNTIAKDIGDLNVSAAEIRDITGVITNIAEQTNLLALNAAIEAARAGEMGLGFAVVAEEVNKLAAQSRVAAKSINSILQGIQVKMETSSETAVRAHKIVEEQLDVVEKAEKTFEEITEAMAQVVNRISNVNSHILGINEVKDQTLQAIMNISSISEQSASASQEVSASIEEQLAIAEQVRDLANQLKKMSQSLVEAISKFQI